MFFEFKDLGVIDEILIPAKRYWRSQKYGFVRFVNVEDPRLVEVKMGNLWLEGKKLTANLSKFQRSLQADKLRGK